MYKETEIKNYISIQPFERRLFPNLFFPLKYDLTKLEEKI